jgi:choline kinase
MASSTKPSLVVLGAGKPSNSGNDNAVNAVPWVLQAIKGQVSSKHFVGGYRLEDRASSYPGFSVSINTEWETSGNVTTLLCALLDTSKSALISYSDIVFRSALVEVMVADNADIVLAVDLSWRVRYARRTKADLERAEKVTFSQGRPVKVGQEVEDSDVQAELVGLMKFSPRVLQRIFGDQSGASSIESEGNIPELLQYLLADGDLSVSCHDVAGDWSELNAPQDLARFVLGTKAETLDRLRSLAAKVYIEDQVRFTSQDFASNAQSTLERVQAKFGDDEVIVRSSSQAEDSWTTANAGGNPDRDRVLSNQRPGRSGVGSANAEQRCRQRRCLYADTEPWCAVFLDQLRRGIWSDGFGYQRRCRNAYASRAP